jgi:hypothetical protein
MFTMMSLLPSREEFRALTHIARISFAGRSAADVIESGKSWHGLTPTPLFSKS